MHDDHEEQIKIETQKKKNNNNDRERVPKQL